MVLSASTGFALYNVAMYEKQGHLLNSNVGIILTATTLVLFGMSVLMKYCYKSEESMSDLSGKPTNIGGHYQPFLSN